MRVNRLAILGMLFLPSLLMAQQALDNGDTDGAHNLATRAKLLLDELTKP